MKYLPLILHNLGRKKLRTAFTVLSIFVSFLLFGLLVALRTGLGAGVEVAGLDRLLTIHKMGMIQFMPVKYARFVEAIDGVEAVTHWTWFGGSYQDSRNQLVMFATDPQGFIDVFYDYEIPEEQKRAWVANRAGILVGQSVADRFGWQVGDRVPINTSLWTKADGSSTWEFDVSGIIGGADGGQVYMSYDYLKEGVDPVRAAQVSDDGGDELGIIGMIYLKLADPDRAAEIIDTIDSQFANSGAETKTTTEKAWAQGFANQVGNIGAIVTAIVGIVFFTLLLVAGNTMAQSVRERTAELGVLKTLGFSDRKVMALVLCESFTLAVVGGLPGLLLADAITSRVQLGINFIPQLVIPTQDLVIGVVLVALLGLVTGALPAWQALRLRIVNALAG